MFQSSTHEREIYINCNKPKSVEFAQKEFSGNWFLLYLIFYISIWNWAISRLLSKHFMVNRRLLQKERRFVIVFFSLLIIKKKRKILRQYKSFKKVFGEICGIWCALGLSKIDLGPWPYMLDLVKSFCKKIGNNTQNSPGFL